VHPCNAQQVASSYLEDMEMVFAENKYYISAFGECGLDYDRLNPENLIFYRVSKIGPM
jgi:Tat protein secretion system quality control protein TatD with DNase activity